MRRSPKTEFGTPNVQRNGNGTGQPARPVATFRPSSPRTDEWAGRPNQEALREIDLPSFEAMIEKILQSEGLPTGVVCGFEPRQGCCKVHTGGIRCTLHVPGGGRVQVTHCGCDNWLTPVAAPPEDAASMARALADEIVWYWRSRSDIAAMVANIAEACEREAAKARALGLDSHFVGARPAEFDTFRGRRQHADAYFDLIHDTLRPQRWRRSFWSALERGRRSSDPCVHTSALLRNAGTS
jgi:hypothetical protein